MAQGVILGQDKPQLQIYVPPGYEDRKVLVGRCRVIVNGETRAMCGATFYRGQEEQWQAHVARCATRHIDEIRRAAPSESNRGTIFDRNGRDLEVESHFRKVGARMRREGRLEVLPHERTS